MPKAILDRELFWSYCPDYAQGGFYTKKGTEGGEIVCQLTEYKKIGFHSYLQGEGEIQAPLCTLKGNLCVQLYVQPSLVQGEPQQRFYILNAPAEARPKSFDELEKLVGTPPEDLHNIVLWYVAESTNNQGAFYSPPSVLPTPYQWFTQWSGVSCSFAYGVTISGSCN